MQATKKTRNQTTVWLCVTAMFMALNIALSSFGNTWSAGGGNFPVITPHTQKDPGACFRNWRSDRRCDYGCRIFSRTCIYL